MHAKVSPLIHKRTSRFPSKSAHFSQKYIYHNSFWILDDIIAHKSITSRKAGSLEIQGYSYKGELTSVTCLYYLLKSCTPWREQQSWGNCEHALYKVQNKYKLVNEFLSKQHWFIHLPIIEETFQYGGFCPSN